ncbi:MAG: hypothetical protein JWN48_6152 [Myxococcaceae bacterium]|nr:hypothetical protein [Myxococcaceae bacterium]
MSPTPVLNKLCASSHSARHWVALTVWLAFAAGAARAEEPSEQSAAQQRDAEYERTIDAALEEYGVAHYEEARGLFEHAHALEPSARTLRGLGMVEFELRHYVRSAELLSAALDSRYKPLTAEQRSAVSELLARTRQFMGRYQLELVPVEAAATVELDGQPAPLDAEHRLSLSAGEHHLRIQADGYAPSELRIDAKGGEERALRVQLRALQSASVSARESEPTHSVARLTRPHRTLGIVLSTTGLAALAAGTALGLTALHRADASETKDGPDADRARHLSLATDVSLGIGAAALVSGAVLWLWRRSEKPPARAGLHIESVLPHVRVRF